MGDTVNIRLTAEDKIHLQQRMDETGKKATEVFKSAIYFTEIDADLSIVNYDDDRRRPVADGRLMAWGELTYAKPLTEKQMEDYELKPAPGNPDRVRPSITARLKEGTRGQEPPKEPGQKRSHKNHEER